MLFPESGFGILSEDKAAAQEPLLIPLVHYRSLALLQIKNIKEKNVIPVILTAHPMLRYWR